MEWRLASQALISGAPGATAKSKRRGR